MAIVQKPTPGDCIVALTCIEEREGHPPDGEACAPRKSAEILTQVVHFNLDSRERVPHA